MRSKGQIDNGRVSGGAADGNDSANRTMRGTNVTQGDGMAQKGRGRGRGDRANLALCDTDNISRLWHQLSIKGEADEVLFDFVIRVEAGDDLLSDVAALVHVYSAGESGFPGIELLRQLSPRGGHAEFDPQSFKGLFANRVAAGSAQSLPQPGDGRDVTDSAQTWTRKAVQPQKESVVIASFILKLRVLRDLSDIDTERPGDVGGFGPNEFDHRRAGGLVANLHAFAEMIALQPTEQLLAVGRSADKEARRISEMMAAAKLDDAAAIVRKDDLDASARLQLQAVVSGHSVKEIEVVLSIKTESAQMRSIPHSGLAAACPVLFSGTGEVCGRAGVGIAWSDRYFVNFLS